VRSANIAVGPPFKVEHSYRALPIILAARPAFGPKKAKAEAQRGPGLIHGGPYTSLMRTTANLSNCHVVTKEYNIDAQSSLDLGREREPDGKNLRDAEKALKLSWRPSRRWLSGIVDDPLGYHQELVVGSCLCFVAGPWRLPRCRNCNGRPDNRIQ
jgi:hypothetical protein